MSQQEEHEVLPALARFVGATIRDKVVLDQLEEINALKSQLEATRRVEITAPGGHPVYASGSFALGDFDDEAHDEDGNVGTVWSVGLTTLSDRKTRDPTIPMHQMSNIEIRIGGVLYATSEDVDGTRIALGIRRGNPFDWCRPDGSRRKGAMHRSVVCQFGGEDKTAFLTFHLHHFPNGPWRSLRSLNMSNRSIAILNELREELEDEEEPMSRAMDMYHHITDSLAYKHPGQRVEMTSISFCVASVREAIGSLRRGSGFEKQKEKYLRRQVEDNCVGSLRGP
jgi:hypothetical protein